MSVISLSMISSTIFMRLAVWLVLVSVLCKPQEVLLLLFVHLWYSVNKTNGTVIVQHSSHLPLCHQSHPVETIFHCDSFITVNFITVDFVMSSISY